MDFYLVGLFSCEPSLINFWTNSSALKKYENIIHYCNCSTKIITFLYSRNQWRCQYNQRYFLPSLIIRWQSWYGSQGRKETKWHKLSFTGGIMLNIVRELLEGVIIFFLIGVMWKSSPLNMIMETWLER